MKLVCVVGPTGCGKTWLGVELAKMLGGEVVSCVDASGRELARGLVNYASDDARRILRAHTEDIIRILGACEAPEMIHRDNLVVLA